MTDAQNTPTTALMTALIRQTAADLRAAIPKRDATLAEVVAKYDEALEHGDEAKADSEAYLLCLTVMLGDPVTAVVERFGQVSKLLKSTQDRVTGGAMLPDAGEES